MAFRMVASFGMSKELGPIEFGHMYNNLSTETKASIENEVRQKLSEAYKTVKTMLTENRNDLDKLAKALLKYETLDREEVGQILKGEDLPNRIPVPPGPMVVHPAEKPQAPASDLVDDSSPPTSPPLEEAPPEQSGS